MKDFPAIEWVMSGINKINTITEEYEQSLEDKEMFVFVWEMTCLTYFFYINILYSRQVVQERKPATSPKYW